MDLLTVDGFKYYGFIILIKSFTAKVYIVIQVTIIKNATKVNSQEDQIKQKN